MTSLLTLKVLPIYRLTSPRDLFACKHLQSTPSILSAHTCVARQHHPTPQPGRRQGKSLSPCHNACADGARVKARIGEVVISDKPWNQIHAARHKAQRRMLDIPCPYCTTHMRRPDRATCGGATCLEKAAASAREKQYLTICACGRRCVVAPCAKCRRNENQKAWRTARVDPAVRVYRRPPPRISPCVCACGKPSMTAECWACRSRAKKKLARKAVKKPPGFSGPLTPIPDAQLVADFAATKSINAVARKYGATFKSVALRLRKVGALPRSGEQSSIGRIGRHVGLNAEVVLTAMKQHGLVKKAALTLGVDPKTIRYWRRKGGRGKNTDARSTKGSVLACAHSPGDTPAMGNPKHPRLSSAGTDSAVAETRKPIAKAQPGVP